MLDQHAGKPFQGPERGTVNHHRSMRRVVATESGSARLTYRKNKTNDDWATGEVGLEKTFRLIEPLGKEKDAKLVHYGLIKKGDDSQR